MKHFYLKKKRRFFNIKSNTKKIKKYSIYFKFKQLKNNFHNLRILSNEEEENYQKIELPLKFFL